VKIILIFMIIIELSDMFRPGFKDNAALWSERMKRKM